MYYHYITLRQVRNTFAYYYCCYYRILHDIYIYTYVHSAYLLNTYHNSSDIQYIYSSSYVLLIIHVILTPIYHNSDPFSYPSYIGGATYDDSPSKRYIYKFYHKEIIVINNKCYAVFSVTGDVFLKGQMARMMGIIIGTYIYIYILFIIHYSFVCINTTIMLSTIIYVLYITRCIHYTYTYTYYAYI